MNQTRQQQTPKTASYTRRFIKNVTQSFFSYYELPATSHEPRATSYELPATSHELSPIHYPLSTIHKISATSCELRATSHPPSTIHYLLLLALLLLAPVFPNNAHALSSVNVSLDNELYRDMEFWAAEGLVSSQMSGIRPYARSEVARQLVEALDKCAAMKNPSATCRNIQSRYKKLFDPEIAEQRSPDSASLLVAKPVESASVSYAYRKGPFSLYNNEGMEYGEGSNAIVQFSSSVRLARVLSVYVQPAFIFNHHYPTDNDGSRTDARLHKGYAKLTLFNVELEVGRDSLWWGPGRHGSLLMSNNAHPFDMIKLSNPEPVLLPWIFSYIGPVQFNLIFSQLNDQRHGKELANPFLYGMRLGVKPHRFLEVGASHLVLFGGPGRRNLNFGEVIKILYGNTDRSGERLESNQQMSVDFSLTLPSLKKYIWIADGFKLYGEIGAEDNGYPPTSRAWLAGMSIYKPFGLERTAISAEYATTILGPYNSPASWYRHPAYPMFYEGRVFGHHTGCEADDFFIEWSQNIDKFFYKLSFDMERSGIKTKANTQLKNQYMAEAGYRLNDHIKFTVRYAYERIEDYGNVAGDLRNNHFAGVEAIFDF
ncbi:MAG: hypothetical protein KA113_14730 [Syntrophaceae bacterium]|nr:hypothetical protein [Syntrophaceae bacterium]